MGKLSNKEQIDIAISYKGSSLSAVAQAIGMTHQGLQRKIVRNTLKREELRKIAKVLGAVYVSYFLFPDGLSIGSSSRNRRRIRRGSGF